jgi:uncharacterized short protein YbdD (DUF466 family)
MHQNINKVFPVNFILKRRSLNIVLKVKIGIRRLFNIVNGNQEYQKYLTHLKASHLNQKPLNKKEFFAKKEQEKWSKINRCC